MRQEAQSKEIATLGGGCFWCLEAAYDEVEGVEKVVSGYAGGDVPNPTYQQICSGATGHAEVVQVIFDPETISYRELLEIFFTIHDPTTLNRQGADVGTQYRSVIFTHTEKQREGAEAMIEELGASERWSSPIVTQVEPLDTFYPAEDYHQDYYAHHRGQPYCRAVIAPKLQKLHKTFKPKLKT